MMCSTIKIGSILLFACLLTACVSIEPSPSPQVDCKLTWPSFPETPRPKLHVIAKDELKGLEPHIVNRLLENDQNLKNYAQRLEAQIETYRVLKGK